MSIWIFLVGHNIPISPHNRCIASHTRMTSNISNIINIISSIRFRQLQRIPWVFLIDNIFFINNIRIKVLIYLSLIKWVSYISLRYLIWILVIDFNINLIATRPFNLTIDTTPKCDLTTIALISSPLFILVWFVYFLWLMAILFESILHWIFLI